MENPRVIGIDLSGPRNIADTCVVVFEQRLEALRFEKAIPGAHDRHVIELTSNLGTGQRIAVGIEAPLSYNPGGGDRPSDKELRRLAREKGHIGAMTPTLMRMVYLTLRGIALTRTVHNV